MLDNNKGSGPIDLKGRLRRLSCRLGLAPRPTLAPPTPLPRAPAMGVTKRCLKCGSVFEATTSNGCRDCGWEGELVPIDDDPRQAA